MKLSLLPLLLFLGGCIPSTRLLTYNAKTVPDYPVLTGSGKWLMVNSYDIRARKYRDNKEELFILLADKLLEYTSQQFRQKSGMEMEFIRDYTPLDGNIDSLRRALLAGKGATHLLSIQALDVFFDQTRVDVTRNSNGSKSREAFYDIQSDVRYVLYGPEGLVQDISERNVRAHSSRSVVSGLLAAGPSITSNREDALSMLQDNADRLLRHFFPGEVRRARSVYTGKLFPEVEKALQRWDYDAALTESLRFVSASDREKAAMANYNCAVLFEAKQQPENARLYLQRSLAIQELGPARSMMRDLQLIQ